MNSSIFKAYDVRGIYPTDVNDQVAVEIGTALSKQWSSGTVIVAHDVRHGSMELAAIIERTFTQNSQGTIKVINVGLSTTPMFYFLVNHFKAIGGVMITASHNPKNYNGFKVVGEGAQMISGTQLLELVSKNHA